MCYHVKSVYMGYHVKLCTKGYQVCRVVSGSSVSPFTWVTMYCNIVYMGYHVRAIYCLCVCLSVCLISLVVSPDPTRSHLPKVTRRLSVLGPP